MDQDTVLVFPNSCIMLDIDVSDKEEVLNILANNLLSQKRISSIQGFLHDVYERESLGETGIENGLAIPHGKSSSVIQITVSFARLKNPIFWETLDGMPVDKIILFAVPNTKEMMNIIHIQLLAKIAGNLVKEGVLEILNHSQDEEEIKNILLF